MNTQEVVNTLVAKENVKVFKNCKIKKATVTVMPTYTRVALTLDKNIQKYMPVIDADGNSDGSYEITDNNIAFTSSFALSGILMDTDNGAFASNALVESPKGFEVVLSGAVCDIVTENVKADEDYVNPFSSNPTPTQFSHDTTVCHPINLKLSTFGDKMLEKLAEKMLGF